VEGTNPSLERECGPRLAVFFTRIQPFTPTELTALTSYICTIPRPPNRYRPVGAEMTPAQRRGLVIFERTRPMTGARFRPEPLRDVSPAAVLHRSAAAQHRYANGVRSRDGL